MGGYLGVGDDDAVILRRRLRVGVGELGVQGQALAARGLRPLDLEVFGGHDDGELLDAAMAEKLRRDTKGECGLA